MNKYFLYALVLALKCSDLLYGYDESNVVAASVEKDGNFKISIENVNSNMSNITLDIYHNFEYKSDKNYEENDKLIYRDIREASTQSMYSFKTLEELDDICKSLSNILKSEQKTNDSNRSISISIKTGLSNEQVKSILRKHFGDDIMLKNVSSDLLSSNDNKDFNQRMEKFNEKTKRMRNRFNLLDELFNDFDKVDDLDFDDFENHTVYDKYLSKRYKNDRIHKPSYHKMIPENVSLNQNKFEIISRLFDSEPEDITYVEKKANIDNLKVEMLWNNLSVANSEENIFLHIKLLKNVLKKILGNDVDCEYNNNLRALKISIISNKILPQALGVRLAKVISSLANNGISNDLFNKTQLEILEEVKFGRIFGTKIDKMQGISLSGFNTFLHQFRIAPNLTCITLPR